MDQSLQDDDFAVDAIEVSAATMDEAAESQSAIHLIERLRSMSLTPGEASILRQVALHHTEKVRAGPSGARATPTRLRSIAENEVLEGGAYDPIIDIYSPFSRNNGSLTSNAALISTPNFGSVTSITSPSLVDSVRSFLLAPSIGIRHMSVQQFVECLTMKHAWSAVSLFWRWTHIEGREDCATCL